MAANIDISAKDILREFFKRVLDNGHCEIYVSHDIDSIVAASTVIRMLSAHNIEAGIYPAILLHQASPSEYSLAIGSRPPRIGSGVAIIRRREGLTRIGEWIVAQTQSSISHEILETISNLYQLPRELRSAVVAGHMSAFTKSVLSQVEDKFVAGLGEMFGSDAIIIKEGLKIMGYGVEENLAYVLETTLDPYIPNVSGNPQRSLDIVSQITSQDGKETLKKISKVLNDMVGISLVSVGLKPIYREDYPFIDPYEMYICLLGHLYIGSSEASTFISTGLPGISAISYRCIYIKKEILTYLSEVFDKSKRVSTYSVKGRMFTAYPDISLNIVWPVHKILTSLSHYQGYAVYEVSEGYAFPIEGSYDPQNMRGFKVFPSGLLIVDDIEDMPEAVSVIGV
ncbi:MAG: hypothetical protein ACO2O0_11555 [Desulfurococcales archaeon]|nr:hypothetical protein [Desulfurococcales archaeon]